MAAPLQNRDLPAVSVREVHKSFPRRRPVGEIVRHPFRRADRVPALNGISLAVDQGEILGLLGPNGAGKTTLLKILCGLVLPEQGAAELYGTPVSHAGLSRLVGLVHGEERSFYWRLTARENLEFYARLHRLERPVRSRLVGDLLEKVDLASDADRRFGDFSSGMRQRLAVARALLADPPLLLMDEPTRSLDPVSAARLRQWIRDDLHRRDGKTILIATHNLREAETLCQRVAIIARGELQAAASPAELRRRGVGGLHYRLEIAGAPPPAPSAGQVIEREEVVDRVRLLVQIEQEQGLDRFIREIHEAGGRVVSCAPEEPDLEQVFHRLVADGDGGDS